MNRSLSALILLCASPKTHRILHRILHSLREFERFELPSAMLPCHPNLTWSVTWFCWRWTGFFLDTSPVRAPVVEGTESLLDSLILCCSSKGKHLWPWTGFLAACREVVKRKIACIPAASWGYQVTPPAVAIHFTQLTTSSPVVEPWSGSTSFDSWLQDHHCPCGPVRCCCIVS